LVEDNVGGIFNLHEAPVVSRLQAPQDRTIQGGEAIQSFVEDGNPEIVGQLLSLSKILNVEIRHIAKCLST
jgi:hypothetical protein